VTPCDIEQCLERNKTDVLRPPIGYHNYDSTENLTEYLLTFNSNCGSNFAASEMQKLVGQKSQIFTLHHLFIAPMGVPDSVGISVHSVTVTVVKNLD